MTVKTLINYSPNFTTYKRNKKNIKYLIYHYTGMRSENKAINRLTDVRSKVSCHYFIKRNGELVLMVTETYEAWHAGISNWKKDKLKLKRDVNGETVNKNKRGKWRQTREQRNNGSTKNTKTGKPKKTDKGKQNHHKKKP